MIQEIKDKPLFSLISPDGTPQFIIMGEDPIMCAALVKLLYKAGISEPLEDLVKKGFTIQPIVLTVKNPEKADAPPNTLFKN